VTPGPLRRRGLAGIALTGTLAAALALLAPPEPASAAAPAQQACAAPGAGTAFGTATPAREDLDAAKLSAAVDELSLRMRLSVQVFRNDCLVAADRAEPVTGTVHNNLWSGTKSVVSMLTGIAAAEGKLRLDDPVGRYLPAGPGWGDAAHRAITVRQLLTQTSGLDQSILAEAGTTGTDPNLAREALAQPAEFPPGTKFQYSQLGPALLAYVVQRAVGQDLGTFAQKRLFTPIGIEKGSYFWLRDRSGLPYGYSNLFLTPGQFARLALLMSDGGRWNGRQVVPASYVAAVSRPQATNGCYGLLFWTNRGEPCTGADIPDAQTVRRHAIPSAPDDAYEMNGTGGQLAVMIPSLHLTVVTTGYFGSLSADPPVLLGASPDEMQYTFFRALMKALRDVRVPDPGPYPGDPVDLDVNPVNYADPAVLLRDIDSSPQCNVVFCDGTVPTAGLAENVRALPGLVPG
jgi:CubicO group peptidase (beta-lactamase class C family)